MQLNECGPVDFNTIRISEDPVHNLRIRIRHNLVDDLSKAKRQLRTMERRLTSGGMKKQ